MELLCQVLTASAAACMLRSAGGSATPLQYRSSTRGATSCKHRGNLAMEGTSHNEQDAQGQQARHPGSIVPSQGVPAGSGPSQQQVRHDKKRR